MTSTSLPKPRLLMPRYTDAQVFRVISAFLSRREFTFTQSMLAKEAVAKGLVSAGDGDGDDDLGDEALGEHLAFLLAQLADEGGDEDAGEEDETGTDADHLERVRRRRATSCGSSCVGTAWRWRRGCSWRRCWWPSRWW